MATATRTVNSKTVWRGSKELARKRAKWHVNLQQAECRLEYEGPYEKMLANAPNIGDVAKGFEQYGVRVFDFTIEPMEGGGKGQMVVMLQNPQLPETQSTFGQVGDSVPQLIWQPYKRRIESHPKCGKVKPGSALPSAGDGHIASGSYDPVAHGWTEAQYRSLLAAGITEYDSPQPVLSLTTFYYSKPNGVGTNNYKFDVPPNTLPIPVSPVANVDWKWLRGGDDLSRQDRLWRLLQSWTGFLPGADRDDLISLLHT